MLTLIKIGKRKDFNPSLPQVPLIIARSANWIAQNALDIEGIFRVSGSHAAVQELRKQFEKTPNEVDLNLFGPQVVSSTIMQWLCDLEAPLFTYEAYSSLIKATCLEDDDLRRTEIVNILRYLPPGNKAILGLLFEIWYQVHTNSEKNKMPSSSLAIILGPTLLRDKDTKSSSEQLANSQRDIKCCIKLVDIIIQQYSSTYKKVFDDYDAPLSGRSSTSPPKKLTPKDAPSSSSSSSIKKFFSGAGRHGTVEKQKKPNGKTFNDPDRIIKPEDHECINSLKSILDDKPAHDAFMSYLAEKEFSDENLKFYESVEKFKGLKLFSERTSFLRELMREYIDENSTYQINIDVDCRKVIEEHLLKAENEAIELPDDVLDEAQTFIFRLINEHSYPRFLQSPHCRGLLAALYK